MCFFVTITEGPPGADDDDDSVTDNFGREHELFGNCICYMFLSCSVDLQPLDGFALDSAESFSDFDLHMK